MSDWRDRRRAYLTRAGRLNELAAEQRTAAPPPPRPQRIAPRLRMTADEWAKRRADKIDRAIFMQGKEWELSDFLSACRDSLDRERYGV